MSFLEKIFSVVPLSNHYIGTSPQWKTKTEPHGALIGYKSANLVIDDGGIIFESPTYNVKFGVEATASCRARDGIGYNHKGNISARCTCGFYSFKEELEAATYNSSKNAVLETVSSGEFIEYSHGYRSEKQRVKKIIVPECLYCSAPPAILYDMSGQKVGGANLYGTCREHFYLTSRSRYITFAEATELLSVPEGFKHSMPVFTSSNDESIPITVEEMDAMEEENRLVEKKDILKAWLIEVPLMLGTIIGAVFMLSVAITLIT